MVRSKEELIGIINDSEISDELKMSLMEDITDSFNMDDYVSRADYEKTTNDYNDLKKKYMERFMSREKNDDVPIIKEDIEDEEKKIIDIREV